MTTTSDFDLAIPNEKHPSPVNNAIAGAPVTDADKKIKPCVKVKAIILGSHHSKVLSQINNRVCVGTQTIMMPGAEVQEGERELTALARGLRDEIGVTISLNQTNCRFILSRTYEFEPNEDGTPYISRINFYVIDGSDIVPRNMLTDSVISLTWLTLTEIQRFLSLASNWKIQLGALDAIEAAMDPAKSKMIGAHAREVSRQDGGSSPDGEAYSKPSPLPYTA
jgi:hypothetical protein